MSKLHAYPEEELKILKQYDQLKSWYKNGLLEDSSWAILKDEYKTSLYRPSFAMRILLFCAALLGITTSLGPVFLILSGGGETAIRVIITLVGVGVMVFTEVSLIANKKHYKSGVVEGCYYAGISYVLSSILFDIKNELLLTVILTLVFLVVAIRYVDIIALIGAYLGALSILFIAFEDSLVYLPFLVMLFSVGVYQISNWLKPKTESLIWGDHLFIVNILCLFTFYLSGNYFVIREMTVSLMGLELSAGQDIPFAFVFNAFTVIVPLVYLFIGIRTKSKLFLRVSLLVLALSAVTIKYYYIPSHSGLGTTLAGLILLGGSLLTFRYLKKIRNGFTRQQILSNKWDNTDVGAFIASQSLGGNEVPENLTGNGGEFGGGGASSTY